MQPRRLIAVLTTAAICVAPAAAAAQEGDGEGPIVGTPPTEDAVTGWASTYLDPDYWAGYVTDLMEGRQFYVPTPADPVKPEAFLPEVPVADSDEYISALPISHVDLSGFTYEWQGETKTVDQFLTTTKTDVVVLVKNGMVVGEWYRNGYGPEVRHQPWSVTKTFVAAVVGIAYHEGLIASLHDPIEAYIPELAGTAWEGATIEELLEMESGVHWDEETPVLAMNSQVQQWVQLATDAYTEGHAGQTRDEFLASLRPADHGHGEVFRYNSANTQVLAWLTEVAYDAEFNEILSEKLWIPMGADGDALMNADRVGSVLASFGLFARPYDYARFGELLRNGGRTPEGHEVVPKEWVEEMVTMTDLSDGAYGYQTWAHWGAGPDAYGAVGFEGQQITVVPSTCLTGVRLSHALGGEYKEDEDPFDPNDYEFRIVTYEEEWEALLAAVGPALGPCAAAAVGDAQDAPAPAGGSRSEALPATGGGAATL
jgi:CubicO group peptidase (beta-lactamase class C family)